MFTEKKYSTFNVICAFIAAVLYTISILEMIGASTLIQDTVIKLGRFISRTGTKMKKFGDHVSGDDYDYGYLAEENEG